MFQLVKEDGMQPFTWNEIGDVQEGRKYLGEQMPVQVYRLLQFTMKSVLVERYGKDETIVIFRQAGELAGKEFAENCLNLELGYDEFIAQLTSVMEEMKIGILRVESFNLETGEATLTIGEDVDCSGLPPTGETVCNYDEGFIAGILNRYTKKNYVVTEVDCWATGSRVCRFKALVHTTDER